MARQRQASHAEGAPLQPSPGAAPSAAETDKLLMQLRAQTAGIVEKQASDEAKFNEMVGLHTASIDALQKGQSKLFEQMGGISEQLNKLTGMMVAAQAAQAPAAPAVAPIV